MPKSEKTTIHYLTYLAYRVGDGLLQLIPRGISEWIIAGILKLSQYRSEVISENTTSYTSRHGLSSITLSSVYRYMAKQILDISVPEPLDIQISNDDIATIKKATSTRIFLFGHVGRWEHAGKHIARLNKRTYAAYQKISNTYIDDRVRQLRENSNITLVDRDKYIKSLIRDARKSSEHADFIVLADQRPQHTKNLERHFFLFKEVGCDPIWEKIHTKYPIEIIYVSQYEKKGQLYVSLLPFSKSESFWEQYLAALTDNISKKPSDYLWSHRRWRD